MNASRGNEPYANFVPVVQSSGMGKSRTVDELAKFVFTLPFNLRPAGETSGFPLPDLAVRDFFHSRLYVSGRETHTALRVRYITFLANLFATVARKVRDLRRRSTPIVLARTWHDAMAVDSFRRELYDTVTGQVYPRETTEAMASENVKQSAKYLLDTIHTWSGNVRHPGGVQLVLYFDESSFLAKEFVDDMPMDSTLTKLDTQRSAYQTLCQAFNNLLDYPIFIMYLSTNSDLASLSPARSKFLSDRYQDAKYQLQAPFVELPFGNWHQPILEEYTYLLDQVCGDEFMVRFGRPLFWSRYTSCNRAARQNIINFAVEKLTNSPLDNSVLSDEASLAVIGVRLLLEFDPGQNEALAMDHKLVADHMRVAFSVPPSRGYMHAGAPSEPILAEAAARVMTRVKVLDILSKYLDNGLIRKGDRHDLVARLLLTLAHDRAAKLATGPNVRYSTRIPVISFLRELVGEPHLKTILNCRPDNIPSGVTFEKAFKDASIHFTHFAKAWDISPVSDDAAWRAMSRGIIFQCIDRQGDIDYVLPILMRSHKELGRRYMSAMLIQTKNSANGHSIHMDADKLNFFSPRRHKIKWPYVTLKMEFGVQPRPLTQSAKRLMKTAQSPTTQTTLSELVVHSFPGLRTRLATKRQATAHPRYAISITGCSPTVYSIIEPSETDAYACLLGSRTFREHPQQDNGRLNAGLRFKPMWRDGLSYEWAAGDANASTMEPSAIPPVGEGISVRGMDIDP